MKYYAESKYNLRNTTPRDTVKDNCPKSTPDHKTLNSLQAGLMDEKSKRVARREYQKLNPKPKIEPPWYIESYTSWITSEMKT